MKLPSDTAAFSFLHCTCRLKSEAITSMAFILLFFSTIWQKNSVIFSNESEWNMLAYINNSFNQYSWVPTMFGSRHSKMSNYSFFTRHHQIISFCFIFFFFSCDRYSHVDRHFSVTLCLHVWDYKAWFPCRCCSTGTQELRNHFCDLTS